MSPKPLISVIVCWHTPDFIDKFKASLAKSTITNYELIEMGGVGLPAKKRNDGAKLAKADYLAFFDDDVEISPDCLEHLYSVFQNVGKCGMVYGKLWKMDEPNRFDEAGGFMTNTGFIWSRAGQNEVDRGQYDNIECILAGKSASCMVKKSIFDEVGWFDESFGILGEETDLSWRIWLRGYKVLFDPWATGMHAFNTKFKPIPKHYNPERVQFNGCRNYITMLIKNLGRSHLWILPIHASIWFTAGCAMLITGKFKQGWCILRVIGYILTHISEILEKRKIIQSTRRVSEKELWRTIHREAPRGYAVQRFLRYLSTSLHG